MKIAKSAEIKKQIEILAQVHARRMDRKQQSLVNLKSYLAESEAQFSTALRSHLINVDTLIDLQNNRLSTLKNQFESDLATLQTEFNTEKYI